MGQLGNESVHHRKQFALILRRQRVALTDSRQRVQKDPAGLSVIEIPVSAQHDQQMLQSIAVLDRLTELYSQLDAGRMIVGVSRHGGL